MRPSSGLQSLKYLLSSLSRSLLNLALKYLCIKWRLLFFIWKFRWFGSVLDLPSLLHEIRSSFIFARCPEFLTWRQWYPKEKRKAHPDYNQPNLLFVVCVEMCFPPSTSDRILFSLWGKNSIINILKNLTAQFYIYKPFLEMLGARQKTVLI